MIDMTMALKILGASIGSSIAVVFTPGTDSRTTLLKRFILGTIIGVIFAPVTIDFFKWEHSPDYWLASATLCGLIGYLVLQILFSEKTREVINKGLNK